MANYRAVANGNWSSGATWGGGAVPPNGAGHSVYSNTFTVAVDTTVDVALITNLANAGTFVGGGTAASGGLFTLNNGSSVTATTIQAGANGANLMTLSGTASASVNGAIIGGSSSGTNCITHSSTGTLTTTGTISSAANTGSIGITVSGNGTLNATGDVFSSTGVNAFGLSITSGGATVTITGNITAGSGSAAVSNSSTSTVTILGTFTASNTANAFVSPNSSATNRLSGSFINSANGTAAIYAAKYILNSTPLNAKTRYALNGVSTYVDMFTADNTGLGPATSDVRSGISYGGGLVGTCAVPAAGSVALGVPVGSTTGTALLTGAAVASAVWDTLTSSLTTAGSIGERVKNCSTAEIVGEQLAAALSTP